MFRFWTKKKKEEYVEKWIDLTDRRKYLRSLIESNSDLLITDRFNRLLVRLGDVESSEFTFNEHISPISEINGYVYNELLSDHIKKLESEFNKNKESRIVEIKQGLTKIIVYPALVIEYYLEMLEEVDILNVKYHYNNFPDRNTFIRKINTENTIKITAIENMLRTANIEIPYRYN